MATQFLDLPTDVIAEMCKLLSPYDIVKTALGSHLLQKIVDTDQTWTDQLCQSPWPLSAAELAGKGRPAKEIFKQRWTMVLGLEQTYKETVGRGSDLLCAAVHPVVGGYLVAVAGRGNTVHVSLATEDSKGRLVLRYDLRCTQHSRSVWNLTWMLDNETGQLWLLSASYDARIVCREVNYNESTKLITMTDGIECARHNNAIFSLSINKSRLASGGADKYLWVWDMQVKNAIGGYKMLHKIPTGHVGDINTVHWLSDTLVLTGSEDSSIKVIDLEQEKVIASTKSGIVWCSVLLRGATHLGLPPAVVIVGTGNSQISICDLDSLQVLMELKGHAGMVRSLTVSHGTVLVSSANTDGRIICWSLKSKTVIREIQVSTAANFSTPSIVCMANHMISVHTDGTLRAWSSVQS